MKDLIIVVDGGKEALSEIMLTKLQETHGKDIIILSLTEAVEQGYVYHKHTYPEPTEPMYLKALPKITQPFLAKETSPIDAISKKRKW